MESGARSSGGGMGDFWAGGTGASYAGRANVDSSVNRASGVSTPACVHELC